LPAAQVDQSAQLDWSAVDVNLPASHAVQTLSTVAEGVLLT
jgi:hypothetical protein